MAQLNDSFVQLSSISMDVNRNESNGENQILGQCDPLSTNTLSNEFHVVEPVHNKSNCVNVSGDISISEADEMNGLLLDSNEIANSSDSGIHDTENNVIHDVENFKLLDISELDINVPRDNHPTAGDILSNGSPSAENETISNMCVNEKIVDACNSVFAGNVNASNVFVSFGDIGTCAGDVNVSNVFDTFSLPHETNSGTSANHANVSSMLLSNNDVADASNNTFTGDVNISNVFSSCNDVDVSDSGTSANHLNVFYSSDNIDLSNEVTSTDPEKISDDFATDEIVDASDKDISAVGVNVSNMCISSGDVGLFNSGGMMLCDFSNEISDGQGKDEAFHDAVEFFKDPSSLNFLETVGVSNTEPESLTRSSMYINFDPIHAKFNAQQTKRLSELVKTSHANSLQGVPEVLENAFEPAENKHLANALPQESVNNILISFDSPIKGKPVVETEADFSCEPPKLYTENELQQIVKDQELNLQETFLKRQHELELERTQKLKELDLERTQELEELKVKNDKTNILCAALYTNLTEVVDIARSFSAKNKALQESLETAVKENAKLQEDLKTSMEDLQSVENTFSDFHKRYEQCKGMLKVYTQNEENMKKQLDNMNIQLMEKDEMYRALQTRTEEMVDKANIEVANVKRACDSQVAVLKAQLKKSELKVSSLENELKHVKIENDKLTSICDDLMAKVSEG